MKIDTLKDLKALVQLCRKQGIDSIEVDGVKLELGDAPVSKNELRNEATSDNIDTGPQYTDEETLLWSSTAHG